METTKLTKPYGNNWVCLLCLALSPYCAIAQQTEPATKKLKEVVVQAQRRPTSVNSISTKIDASSIEQSMGQSLASLLERISGLSSIQTGVSTAKPVIHGMHGNRILIVNNGARQNGQQWGEGHAPEIDMHSSEAIYVVKGAESVRYGSEAMGGVIVMEPRSLAYGARPMGAKLNLQYGTNGRRWGSNLLLEGAVPTLTDWAWRVQGSYTNAGDRYTGQYILNNTGEREANLSMALGYHKGAIKVEGFYSRYDSQHGVMKVAQMGNINDLYERILIGQPTVFTDWTRSIDYPREHVVHHNLSIRASYDSPRSGEWRYQFTYQDDARREFRIRRSNNSHVPEVDLRLKSQQHQLRWVRKLRAFTSEVGTQYQHINNYSIAGNGVPPIIPNYVEDSWGVYGIGRYGQNRWSLEAGLRLDGQRTKAEGYDIVGQAYGGESRFTNLTYSLGGRYVVGRGLYLKSNFGVAWRAPHVHELYSNGHDHGSAAFVRGDARLQSENSYKWVTSVQYRSGGLSLNLDAYLQWVNNYIYDMPQMRLNPQSQKLEPQTVTVLSGSYPLFQFLQTDAFFRGIDFEGSYEFSPWLRYELRTALIFANEQKSGAYLPYIPPMRIDHSLALTLPNFLGTSKTTLALGHRYVSKQRRFDPHKDLTPNSPPAYQLWNAELSMSWALGRGQELSFRFIGENILDKHYKEYTNRARYYSHDAGRDLRLQVGWRF